MTEYWGRTVMNEKIIVSILSSYILYSLCEVQQRFHLCFIDFRATQAKSSDENQESENYKTTCKNVHTLYTLHHMFLCRMTTKFHVEFCKAFCKVQKLSCFNTKIFLGFLFYSL